MREVGFRGLLGYWGIWGCVEEWLGRLARREGIWVMGRVGLGVGDLGMCWEMVWEIYEACEHLGVKGNRDDLKS